MCPVGIGGYTPSPEVSSRVWLEGAGIHKVWSTPAGELQAAVRYDDRWPHGLDIPLFSDHNIAYFTKPWLESERDLECLKQILRPAEDRGTLEQWRFQYREAKRLADRWQLATFANIGMGLTGAMHLFGAEALCLLVMENPDLVDAYLELEHRLNLRNLEIAVDFGVDIIKRNGFYETSDFYGPELLARFLEKRLTREIETVHKAGKLICYTVHTGLMPMSSYLRRFPFDCLMQVEIASEAAAPGAIRDSQEGTKSFWLGPSDTYHLWGDPEGVRAAVREVFQVFGPRGLILSGSPSIISITPWPNVLAMIDEWKKLRSARD